MAGLAPYQDGVPAVASAADREARFPLSARIQNQRVFRLDTQNQERWNGSSWIIDFLGGPNASPEIAGIPVVASSAARDAAYPSPMVNQRVQNLGTGRFERYNGSVWLTDILPENLVDPRLFGVKADWNLTAGTGTDDTVALQAYITEMGSFIPTTGIFAPQSPFAPIIAGVCKISNPLIITAPIAFKGSGPEQTLIYNAATNSPAILIQQDQSQSTYVTYDVASLGVVGRNTDFSVQDGQDGIQITTTTNDITARLVDVRVSSCTGNGINHTGQGNSCQFIRCITQNNAKVGLLLQTGTTGFQTNFLVDGCISRQNRIGIYLSGFSSTVRVNSGRVTNSLCESNNSGTSGTIGSADRPSIGLKMDNCTAVLVQGNYMENQANDLYLASPCFYNKFFGNFWLQSNSWTLPHTYGGPPPVQLGVYINNGFGNLFVGNTYGSEPTRPSSCSTTDWGTGSFGDTYPYVTDLLGGEVFRDEIGLYFADVSDLEPQFAVTNPNGYHAITSYLTIGGRNLAESQYRSRKAINFLNSNIVLNDLARQIGVNNSAGANAAYNDSIVLIPTGATYNRIASDSVTPTTIETISKSGIVSQVFASGTATFKRSYGSAPPVSGAHTAGEIVINSNPAANAVFAWICVVSGTPGTWQPFAYIGPNLTITGGLSANNLTTTAGAAIGGAFGCNGATAQTPFASGGAAPAGGTGATAGAYDTAAHRDALITLVNNMRTALVANGIMS